MTIPSKVLIVEDDRIIARDLFETIEEMRLHPEKAHSYEEGMEVIQTFQPDLLLCDINLGTAESGVDFAAQALKKYPSLKIIYITAHSDPITLESIAVTNPSNFIVKPFSKKQLVATITLALDGFTTSLAEARKTDALSQKEKVILKFIAEKLSSKQIADEMGISEKTVRNHRYNIAKKLNLPQENNSLLTWAMSYFSSKK